MFEIRQSPGSVLLRLARLERVSFDLGFFFSLTVLVEPGRTVFGALDRVGADHDSGYRNEAGGGYAYFACDGREDVELERG